MTIFAMYGAGEMGSQIAEGFLTRGDTLLVNDPYTTRVWPGTDLSKESIATAADVHLITVRGADTANAVMFGRDGLTQFAKPTSLALLMTTMTPVDVSLLVEEGLRRGYGRIADAAMSRRKAAIADRSLTILLGADQTIAADAVAACSVFADNVTHVGGVGTGMTAKLVNNWLLQANRGSLIQAAHAARAFGIDTDRFVDFINSSSGSSWVSSQWSDAERSLLQGEAVEATLAERTEDEVVMLVESLRSIGVEFDPAPVDALIEAMKGGLSDKS